jgi:TM2 domain-containing membrane protein YozV
MADVVEIEMLQWVQSLPADQRAGTQLSYMTQRKQPGTALVLSLLCFFGFAGVGRMYIGHVGMGVAMFLLNFLTCGVWAFVDLFLIQGAALAKNRLVLQRMRGALGG